MTTRWRRFGSALFTVLWAGSLALPHTAARSGEALETPPILAPSSVAGTWAWPLPGRPHILRSFEAPATRYSAGHRGIDLVARAGDVVVAPAAGIVSFAGVVVDRPVLSITAPGGLVASVEPVLASVTEGEALREGDAVGIVATGGHCADACVHFGVRLYGEYVNPLALVETLPRAVLLPLREYAPVTREDAPRGSSP